VVVRLENFYVGSDEIHELTGFLGRETAIVYSGGDRSHGRDDVVRVVDCWQREVDRSAVAPGQ